MKDCAHCPLGPVGSCPLASTQRPAGALLIAQGEVATGVFMIREGSVLLSTTTRAGDEAACVLRPRGSVIGLEALRGEPAPYEAWTLTPARLCHLSPGGVREWVDAVPQATRAFLELALAELTRAREERVALAGNVVSRVARFLEAHLRAHGGELALEQRVLARLLRMRSETLSRALAKLRSAGALAPGRRVLVRDPKRLAALAAED